LSQHEGAELTFGYPAGYLDLNETYFLGGRFAQQLRETFSSWAEAVENYLDGCAYWSGVAVNASSITEYKRRSWLYQQARTDTQLFDPAVWTEPVRSVSINPLEADVSL
jgi:hypothetical protein